MSTIVFARIALAVAVVGFLMPWLTFPPFSGFTLATGLLGGRSMGVFWPYLVGGSATLVALLASFGNPRDTGGVTGAVSVIAIVAVFGGTMWIRSEADKSMFGALLQQGAGYWITLVSLAVAAVTGFMASAGKEMPKLAGAAPAAKPDEDVAAWDRIADKDNADALQEYLLRHPDGRFSELARMKLERMGVTPLKPAAPVVASEPVPAKPALADDLLFPSETTPRVAEKVTAEKPDDLLAGASASRELPKEPGPVSPAALAVGVVVLLVLIGGGVAWWVFNGGAGSSAPDAEAGAPATVVERPVERAGANEPAPPAPPSWDELLRYRVIEFGPPGRMQVGQPVEIEVRMSKPAPGAPPVEEMISAQLTGLGFDISQQSVGIQKFSQGENAWRWRVTPTDQGQRTLRLELFAHAGDGSTQEIEVYEKAVLAGQRGVIPPGQSGPYWPATPVRVTATEVRVREAPSTTPQTKVLGVATPGEELDVIGLAKQPDWYWYEVKFDDGSTGFVRSDLTSAPMQDPGARPPQAVLPDFVPNTPAPSAVQPAPPAPAPPGAIDLRPGQPVAVAPPPRAPTRPSPDQTALIRWLSDSYPASARRARQQGDVAVSMCVGPDGRARDVKLTRSSGSAALDEATVKGIPMVRFNPGRNEAGNPVDWCNPPYPFIVAWRLPSE